MDLSAQRSGNLTSAQKLTRLLRAKLIRNIKKQRNEGVWQYIALRSKCIQLAMVLAPLDEVTL